jgi:hypothetical protein
MRLRLPFGNKRHPPVCAVLRVGNISPPSALARHAGAPRLDLMHAGALHRRNMTPKAWMLAQPAWPWLALVPPPMIADHRHGRKGRGRLAIHMLPTGEPGYLACALGCWGIDCPPAAGNPGQQLQGTCANRLVPNTHRPPRWCGLGRGLAYAWGQPGVFVHTPLPVPGQPPWDGWGRERGPASVVPQLPGQCRAIPWRPRLPADIGAFTRLVDHSPRRRRGNNGLVARACFVIEPSQAVGHNAQGPRRTCRSPHSTGRVLAAHVCPVANSQTSPSPFGETHRGVRSPQPPRLSGTCGVINGHANRGGAPLPRPLPVSGVQVG